MIKRIILIFGDQLDHQIHALGQIDANQDLILMGEVVEEATHIKHHKQKLVLVFAAMRQFATELKARGLNVHYHNYNPSSPIQSFTHLILEGIQSFKPQSITMTEPSEYRVKKMVHDWRDTFDIPLEILDDKRFFCPTTQFNAWASGRKQLRMEFFYREMRKQHGILMEGDQPIGGQWNYDPLNRKPPPKKGLTLPTPCHISPNPTTLAVKDFVNATFADHFGELTDFHYATNRDEALTVLNHFITTTLPQFGDYQDAMLMNEPWMFHSHLGFYLNCGLLRPRECVALAEEAYHKGHAPLHAVEGFIRQILGWREFIRGIYWLKMPEYPKLNYFNATKSLPSFYWTGKTTMRCLQQCVQQTQNHAYAHHIQRLMVLGNFALLTGITPEAVNEWFWIVYADAYEWVELPNVSGMALFADGGALASKPYAASGAYIHKMSNYCQNCQFNVKEKTGPSACPFNYLYWHFIEQHADKLAKNPRMALIYKAFDKLSDEQKTAIKQSAEHFLANLT